MYLRRPGRVWIDVVDPGTTPMTGLRRCELQRIMGPHAGGEDLSRWAVPMPGTARTGMSGPGATGHLLAWAARIMHRCFAQRGAAQADSCRGGTSAPAGEP